MSSDKILPIPFLSFPNSEVVGELAARKVLLIEDAPDKQRIYAAILQRAGADVSFECNGAAAVKAVFATEVPFDAVVIDMTMPILDGIAAIREIRRRGFGGKVIAFTAHHRDETEKVWYQAGCDAYLVKPVTPALLTQTLVHNLPTCPVPMIDHANPNGGGVAST